VFMALSMVTWAQCLHYNNEWRSWTAGLLACTILVVFGGIEAALIFTLRPVYESGHDYPVLIIGVVAAVLLAAGLLPPYFEIFKRNGRVVGISIISSPTPPTIQKFES
jgi:hypothetical protein